MFAEWWTLLSGDRLLVWLQQQIWNVCQSFKPLFSSFTFFLIFVVSIVQARWRVRHVKQMWWTNIVRSIIILTASAIQWNSVSKASQGVCRCFHRKLWRQKLWTVRDTSTKACWSLWTHYRGIQRNYRKQKQSSKTLTQKVSMWPFPLSLLALEVGSHHFSEREILKPWREF